MEKKFSLTLDKEFIDYCNLNKIEDFEGLAKKVFNNGFTILKYGNKPYVTEDKVKSNVKIVTSPQIKEKSNDLYGE